MSLYITDENWQAVVDESVAAGHPPGALPRQTSVGGLACAFVYSEAVPLIPQSEWPNRIREMTANGVFIGQRWQSDPKADHQNGYSTCWAYSLAQAVMANRARMGLPFVQLSAESLAEDVGYRNRGNYLDSALTYAAKWGLATRATVSQYDISGRWNPAYKDERQNYIPLEWWDLGGKDVWAETVTALLSGHGCYVGYDWWRHAVFLDMLRVGSNGRIEAHTPNSHGPGKDVWLGGSKPVPSMGSFVIRSATYTRADNGRSR